MSHKNAKMLFTAPPEVIDGADRGRARANIEALLGGGTGGKDKTAGAG